MKIFEASGTFNPSDFGLSVGDMIQIICVGGGGSGGCNYSMGNKVVNGNAGTASAFGTIISAQGGAGGNCSLAPSSTVGQYLAGSVNNVTGASGGGGGWYPGTVHCGGTGIGASSSALDASAIVANMTTGGVGASENMPPLCSTAMGGGYGNKGYYAIAGTGCLGGIGAEGGRMDTGAGGTQIYCSGGGAGYGAGGGAASFGGNGIAGAIGGNSGEVKQTSYILSDLNEINVTVGTGGAYVGYDSNIRSGKGANGCVCVFW